MIKLVKYNYTNRDLVNIGINHVLIFFIAIFVLSIISDIPSVDGYLIGGILILLSCQVFLFLSDFYEGADKSKPSRILYSTFIGLLSSVVVLESASSFLKKYEELYFDNLLLAMSTSLLAIYLFRHLIDILLERMKMVKKIIIIGVNESGFELVKKISEKRNKNYKVIGFIDDNPNLQGRTVNSKKVIGSMSDLHRIVKEKKVDYIIVTTNERGSNTFCSDTLLKCKFDGYKVLEYQGFYELLLGKINTKNLRPSWFIFSDGFKISITKRILKRMMSIILSVIGLLVTSPFMLIAALLVKIDSKGPIFFKQTRVGKNGKIFTLIKFRTMREDAEKYSGPVWAQDDDPRITNAGKMLRKFRIDELPQMFNVLKGEMSFVGPRPERPFFVEQLKKQINYYGQRLTVEPGITGWAAIKCGYSSTVEDAIEKLQYDLFYIK
ncbi:sugar transferase, partial [bacterium]|nr:sugar transferase [bacterium]